MGLMGLFKKSNPILEESDSIRKKFYSECKDNWKKVYSDSLEYLGGCIGFPDFFKERTIAITVYSGALVLESGPTLSTEYKFFSYTIPVQNIISSTWKDEIQIQKEVTLTRLIALGIFALGAKKETKSGCSYLIIDYKDLEGNEQKMLFRADAKTAFSITSTSSAIMKAKKLLLNNVTDSQYTFIPKYGFENSVKVEFKTSEPVQSNIPEQIKKLSDLKEQGILTEEEFQTKKTELLAKI